MRDRDRFDGPATRLRGRDLVGESLTAIAGRPARAALTVLGVVIGIGLLVAVTGVSSTASGQISTEFSVLAATEVTLDDVGPEDPNGRVFSFAADAGERAATLHGVRAAGLSWPLPVPGSLVRTTFDPRSDSIDVPAQAASPGYLAAVGASLAGGRLIDQLDEDRRLQVAVLGDGAARRLGISDVARMPTVYVAGTAYAVVGIIDDVERSPDVLSTIYIPTSTALQAYGRPSAIFPARMLIATDLGAAQQVAREAPLALRPDAPEMLQARPLPQTSRLETNVTGALGELFLALAAVALFISLISVAIATLSAVLQRTAEFGLRRSIGARPRHLLAQVLVESGTLGLLGGLLATGVGNGVVLGIALVNQWTALVDLRITLAAPLAGLVAGLVGGAYPAWRAGRIEPVEALRR